MAMTRTRRRSWLDRYLNRRARITHRRAAADNPRYREITEGRELYTLSEVEELIEITSQYHNSTLEKLAWRTKFFGERHPLISHPIRTWRTLSARARHGWAPQDTWNLQRHLGEVIAGSVEHLRDNTHSYPAGTTPQEWEAILTEIAEGFRAYDAVDPNRVPQETAAKLQRSHELLARWWGDLWD